MNLKARYWLLIPLLLFLTGCEQWDRLFLDDAGKPAIEQQEFAWFLINVFKLVFDNPLRFLGIAIGIFLLLAVGGSLWAKGGLYKLLGLIMVVAGITAYCVIVGVVFIFAAMALGLIIGGFRRG